MLAVYDMAQLDTWGARAFKDIMVNENNQQNHIGTFLYLTQVKAVISATSYYQFLGSTPFEITWWLQSATQILVCTRCYNDRVVTLVTDKLRRQWL